MLGRFANRPVEIMKIIYFSPDYCTHDHRFLTAIRDAGHQVFHLRLQSNLRQVEDRPVPEGVKIVHWAGGRREFRWRDVPRLVASLKRVIKRIQPDLIHAGPIQTSAFIAVLAGFRPVLTMSWGFDLMEDVNRGVWWKWVTGYVLERSTFFTSDAMVTRDIAVKYGMNPDRTVVFPWGVDLDQFTPKTWRTGKPENSGTEGKDSPFTLFCNRSWEPRYGVDVLARAFVRVAGKYPSVRLLLLGGGSQSNRLRHILLGGGVLDLVHMPGQVSQTDLPGWYHKADIYISPSHVDGSSVSLLEALASGLPCLVSDIPANKEWVAEGENGWLFPDGDADKLADRITQAIEGRDGLPAVGRTARAVAEARADWKLNSQKLLYAYEQALQVK
jgi:glycosyltransferase involved in cell wall biosynthesis